MQVVRGRTEAGILLHRVILHAEYFEEVASELSRFAGEVRHGEDIDFRR